MPSAPHRPCGLPHTARMLGQALRARPWRLNGSVLREHDGVAHVVEMVAVLMSASLQKLSMASMN
jgi:hypothetical protein